MADLRRTVRWARCLLTLALLVLPTLAACGGAETFASTDAAGVDVAIADRGVPDGPPDDLARVDSLPQGCPAVGSDVAAGIVTLLNAEQTDAALLERGADAGGAGLDAALAQRLVDGRPYANFGQLESPAGLDDVSCEKLARLACELRKLCGPRLRVVTWNLKTFPLAAGTIAAVAQQIGLLDADVIGVQEIQSANSFNSLVAALPAYEGVLAKRGYFSGVGLLYRRSSVVAVDHESLFTDDKYGFPRPALHFRGRLAGGREISFIVMHLKAMLDAESQKRRVAACAALDKWLRARSSEEVFVIGDWNDELLDAPADNIFSTLLDAPQDYSFTSLLVEKAGGYSYLPFSAMIDHIMVTNDVLAGRDGPTCFIPRLDASVSNYISVLSDHLPVVATFPR
jgi:endonuclease/exonuclease/phosphatase family metal-dependent hydrolase